MNFVWLVVISIVGYLIDLALNFVIARYILKSNATVASVAFFEFLHNFVTFFSGLIFGLSIISLSGTIVLQSGIFIVAWFIVSFFLVRKILGFESVKKTLAYLGADTVLDYGLGGIAAIPAGLFLLSTIPTTTSTSPASHLSPLSLRPAVLILGLVIVIGLIFIQRAHGEQVDVIAEEEEA